MLFIAVQAYLLLALSIERINSAPIIPPEWKVRILEGNMLYSHTEPSDSSLQASVGNGYIATVIGSDTQYIAGVYNGLNSVTPSHRARIPATTAITINNMDAYGSALDLERGIFYRRSWSGECVAEQRWYAHRSLRNLLVHEIEVSSGSSSKCVVELSSEPGAPSQDFRFSNYTSDNYVFTQGQIRITEEMNSSRVGVAYVSTLVPSEIVVVGKNLQKTSYFFTTTYTTLETDDPLTACLALMKLAEGEQETLLAGHISAWYDLWSSRIEVSGDLPLAQAINSSLYYILSSVRADWEYAPSPGGLASNGYNGHAFWDSETWMFPTFALMYPETATAFINYRFNRMAGAILKAQSYNMSYAGTMYPWESAFTGKETCPSWASTGELEQHISGDVAFALEQYWRLTGNVTWLKQTGYPMLEQIATFWVSRVAKQGSMYVIDGVIPPDEYAVNVNNSVYTNVVCKYSLEFAYAAAQVLNLNPPESWLAVANNIKIPFDSVAQIHPEFDGYKGQTIKQADVVLLGFPLMYPMNSTVRYNDLVYYSNRTDPNGPAMTWGMHAIAWLELGHYENAADIFARSYANIQPPFNVWTETPTGGTVNFITGAGGFLQAVWGGWAGLRIEAGQITLNPNLPPSVTSLKIAGLQYLGSWLDIEYDADSIYFTLNSQASGSPALFVSFGANSTPLNIGKVVSFSVGKCALPT
eukprot:TRINITY_DN8295_c0_g1_i1.p1 TRINITY_DN8295_c0_g1~~TRINITY_DN8295_c0_g1_i1.p1  ORF type:complete len:699 (+),score=116.92 TRINITY_DN8295_c0_g1_i1:246-2342(+)